MTIPGSEGGLSALVTGGTLITVVGYIITIERRLTRVDTKIGLILERMRCLWRDTDEQC